MFAWLGNDPDPCGSDGLKYAGAEVRRHPDNYLSKAWFKYYSLFA